MPDFLAIAEADAKTLLTDFEMDAIPVIQPILASLANNLASQQPSIIGAEEQGSIALNQFLAAQPQIWGAFFKQAEALVGGQISAYLATLTKSNAAAVSAATSADATGATGA